MTEIYFSYLNYEILGLYAMPTFRKLWSAKHQWSLRSVPVVLKIYRRKNKIQKNYYVSHCSWKSQSLEMTHGNRFSLFLLVLTFYEIYYPIHLPISNSTFSNKRGFKALWTWCFCHFPCTSGAASVTQPGTNRIHNRGPEYRTHWISSPAPYFYFI